MRCLEKVQDTLAPIIVLEGGAEAVLSRLGAGEHDDGGEGVLDLHDALLGELVAVEVLSLVGDGVLAAAVVEALAGLSVNGAGLGLGGSLPDAVGGEGEVSDVVAGSTDLGLEVVRDLLVGGSDLEL